MPGDRLWVRETLRLDGTRWKYAADGLPVWVDTSDRTANGAAIAWAHHKEGDVCVSIHMPRWASRITLEVTDVRVQRVREISEEDARSEGCPGDRPVAETLHDYGNGYLSARVRFCRLWDSINSKRDGCSWDANPWTFAISFKRVESQSEAA